MKALLSRACCVLLLTGSLLACKKDEAAKPAAAPVPDLVGTWEREKGHTRRVDTTGTVTYDRVTTDIVSTLVMTTTRFTSTSTLNGSTSVIDGTYVRSGNTVTVTAQNSGGVVYNVPLEIMELTATNLTLRQTNHDIDSPGDTETIDTRYHR